MANENTASPTQKLNSELQELAELITRTQEDPELLNDPEVIKKIQKLCDQTGMAAFETKRPINPEAEALNKTLEENNPVITQLLSLKGIREFFPANGILAQVAEAKGTKHNATIGVALQNNPEEPFLSLPSLTSQFNMSQSEVVSYSPSYGITELREVWQSQIHEKNPSLGEDTLISKPVVVAGLTHGLSVVGDLFLNPGDEVIMTSHFWGNYKKIYEERSRATIDTYPTFTKENTYNLPGLREKMMKQPTGKKFLHINEPNNPTGYTSTNEEQNEIYNIILESAEAGNQIIVVLDDAYFNLTYSEDASKESLFARLAKAHENILAIKVDGATKEDYAWGLRVGFVTYGYKGMTPEAAEALEDKTAGSIRGEMSNNSTPGQNALLHALKSSAYPDEKAKNKAIMKSRWNAVQKTLKDNEENYSKYFTPVPNNSGYFMCIQLSENIAHPSVIENLPDHIRRHLIEKHDVGTISISGLLRISYSAIEAEDIPDVFDHIYKACEEVAIQHNA